MFNVFEKLKNVFAVDETDQHKSLEEFIIRGNPQNANDIDILTRQYYNMHDDVKIYGYFPYGGPHR